VADAGDVEADPEPGSTAAAPVPAVDPEPAAVEPDPEPPAVEPDPEPPKEDPAPAADGPKGQLLVNSSPKSLAVQIDGSAVGTTPYTGAYTLGAHRVVVIGPGGMVCEKQATVVSARPTLTSCTFDGQQGESQDDDSRRRR
jgi:hypothetical protein